MGENYTLGILKEIGSLKKVLSLVPLTIWLISFNAFSQSVLLSWDIPTSASPNSTTSPTSVTSSENDAAVEPSTIFMGPGIISSIANSTGGWGGTSWGSSTNQTLDFLNSNGDWFNFAVTAKPGKVVTISGVGVLSVSASGAGPGNWALLSSTNTNNPSGFASNAIFASGVPRASSGAAGYTNDVSAAWSSALTGSNIVIPSGKTVFFRIVGYNGATASGSGRIQGTSASGVDFTLLGTSADAPIQNFTWNGGPSGSWSYTEANWLDGNSSSAIFVEGNNAIFNLGSDVTIVGTGVSVGLLTNNVVSGAATRLTGGSLSAASIVNSGSGNLVIEVSNSAATLANIGTGTLTLSAPGTYTTVNVTNGTIQATTNTALTGAINILSSGALDVGASSNSVGIMTVSNGVVSGTGILTASGSSFTLENNDQTVAASIRGTGNLTKTGSKVLTLSGSNTFSGDININAGTLATFGADRLPDTATVSMAANTVFRLGGNETIRALSAATTSVNSAQVDLQSYQLTLNVTSSNAFVGAIVGSGSMVKNGASILTLNENSTFSGGTTLNAGSFRLQASGNRTTNGDGTVTLASSPYGAGILKLAGGSIFSSSASSRVIYNSCELQGSITFGDANLGPLTVSTNVTGASTLLSSNSTLTVISSMDWEQPIIGPAFNLTKAGTNSLTLWGTNNLNTLSITAGSLEMRNSNNISTMAVESGSTVLSRAHGGTIGQINVAGGGVLSYRTTNTAFGNAVIHLSNGATLGQAQYMGPDSTLPAVVADRQLPNKLNILGNVVFGLGNYANYFSGNIDLNGQERTLAINNSTYISGVISNGALTLDNGTSTNLISRTLTLSAANTYSGGTKLTTTTTNGPILAVANNTALGTGDLTFVNVGTLKAAVANWSLGNNITINSGVAATFDAGSNNVVDAGVTNSYSSDLLLSGSVSGAGSLMKINDGLLTLSGALSYAGGTTVSGGTLRIQKTGLTADITTNTVTINFYPAPSDGTNNVLPGALNGTYGTPSINGLSAGQSATFDPATGQVVVQSGLPPSGPTFGGAYPGKGLSELAPNGLTYLMNYAFGGNSSNASKLPSQDMTDPTKLTLYAFVRTNDNTLTVVGETGSSLASWDTNTPVPGIRTPDQAGAPDGTERRAFTVNASGNRLFLRLKATK